MGEFTVKDSGVRQDYPSGMRRDTQEGKTNFLLAIDGPMFERYAEHMTKGAAKYGPRNWQLAESEEELERFKASALRHMFQWLAGDRDEDHAAAVWFNVNAAEYVRSRLELDVDYEATFPLPDVWDAMLEDPFEGDITAVGGQAGPVPLFHTKLDYERFLQLSDPERAEFYEWLEHVPMRTPCAYCPTVACVVSVETEEGEGCEFHFVFERVR